MNCPQCAAVLPSGGPVCSYCGFSIQAVRGLLGSDWVLLERVTDPGNILSLVEKKHLEECLDEFERRFPQCFLGIYLGCLPQVLTPAAMGFWLVNHGAFHTSQVAKRNDFGLAWVIDPRRCESALILGYALEPLLPEAVLQRVMGPALRYLAKGRFDRAGQKLVASLSASLAKAGQRVTTDAEVLPPELETMGLHKLRPSSRMSRQSAPH